MRVILCGYHWTGCKALELLLQEGHEVFVYTHETQNCIADLEGLCIKKKIAYSLDKIDINNIPFIPDMICSIYYRYLIKPDIIDAVNGKIFNLHPALLPKYRGCSSLTWAIINGEEECGFTYHYIDAGCDTGNIILQKAVKIEDFDTQLTLYNRVMFESMQYFLDVVQAVKKGYEGEKQEGTVTFYKRGCPFEGKLDDAMDYETKERFLRAMCYPPYPSAQYHGREIQTLKELLNVCKGGGKIAVFGCGGHARSVVNTIYGTYGVKDVLLVDENAQNGEIILGCKTACKYDLNEKDAFIVAVGDNNKRKTLYLELNEHHRGHCFSVVAESAQIEMNVKVGIGTFIAPYVCVGPQAKVGDNTIINTGSVIEHETVIGSHTHIAPHATICGRSKIGDNVFCGAASTVIDGISICDDVIVGAGAVVKEDIVTPGTYVGVPARRVS